MNFIKCEIKKSCFSDIKKSDFKFEIGFFAFRISANSFYCVFFCNVFVLIFFHLQK